MRGSTTIRRGVSCVEAASRAASRRPRLDRPTGGFTLVELVVVVMILGILAAIALPRLLGTSQQATDNAVKQSLSVIRTAIDHFAAAHNGTLPGADGQEATFKADMADYLRGSDFPVCPVGTAKNGNVRMVGGIAPLSTAVRPSSGHSWVYEYATGDFGINSTDVSNDKITTYDEF